MGLYGSLQNRPGCKYMRLLKGSKQEVPAICPIHKKWGEYIASLLDDVKKIAGHQFSLKRLSTGEWGIDQGCEQHLNLVGFIRRYFQCRLSLIFRLF